MKQTNKLFQKEISLKFPLSAIDRKTIVLLTGFILLLTCTITGCGSNSQQQSTLPVTESIPIENPAQEESAQEVQNQSVSEQPDMDRLFPGHQRRRTRRLSPHRALTLDRAGNGRFRRPGHRPRLQIPHTVYDSCRRRRRPDDGKSDSSRAAFAPHRSRNRRGSPSQEDVMVTAVEKSSSYP